MGRSELIKALIGAWIGYDELPGAYDIGTPDNERLASGSVHNYQTEAQDRVWRLDEQAAEDFITWHLERQD